MKTETNNQNAQAPAGSLARPGSAGYENYWAIIYEDADRMPEIFTDESAAREVFAARLVAWNCHLFRSVPNPQAQRPAVNGE